METTNISVEKDLNFWHFPLIKYFCVRLLLLFFVSFFVLIFVPSLEFLDFQNFGCIGSTIFVCPFPTFSFLNYFCKALLNNCVGVPSYMNLGQPVIFSILLLFMPKRWLRLMV